jgi:hypothetical protein
MGGQEGLKLGTVRHYSHTAYLAVRSQNTHIQSDKFEKAWDAASTRDRYELFRSLSDIEDMVNIPNWIKAHLPDDLELMSLTRLKERAQTLGVRYWSRLPKSLLIMGIREKENAHEVR